MLCIERSGWTLSLKLSEHKFLQSVFPELCTQKATPVLQCGPVHMRGHWESIGSQGPVSGEWVPYNPQPMVLMFPVLAPVHWHILQHTSQTQWLTWQTTTSKDKCFLLPHVLIPKAVISDIRGLLEMVSSYSTVSMCCKVQSSPEPAHHVNLWTIVCVDYLSVGHWILCRSLCLTSMW